MNLLNDLWTWSSDIGLLAVKWGAAIGLGGVVCYAVVRIVLWAYRALMDREYKKLLFTLEGLYVTVIHDVILTGVLGLVLCAIVQWNGYEVNIMVPTIEHTFKK